LKEILQTTMDQLFAIHSFSEEQRYFILNSLEAKRHFKVILPPKNFRFQKHGFGKFDACALIKEKILNLDFSSIIDATKLNLRLYFTTTIKGKELTMIHEIHAPEVLATTLTLTNIFNRIQDQETKNAFELMLNKVNFLEGKIEELQNKIHDIEPKDLY
jgi:hypothetical protein